MLIPRIGSSVCHTQVPRLGADQLQPGHDDGGADVHLARGAPPQERQQAGEPERAQHVGPAARRRPTPAQAPSPTTATAPTARSRARTHGCVAQRVRGEVDQAVPGRDVRRHVVEAVEVDLQPGREGVLHHGGEGDHDQRLRPHQRAAPATAQAASTSQVATPSSRCVVSDPVGVHGEHDGEPAHHRQRGRDAVAGQARGVGHRAHLLSMSGIFRGPLACSSLEAHAPAPRGGESTDAHQGHRQGQGQPGWSRSSRGATVRDLLDLLAENNIGALVVSTDGQRGRRASSPSATWCATSSAPTRTRSRSGSSAIMTSTVHTCAPDADLDEMMGAMTERRIRHVPVVSRRTAWSASSASATWSSTRSACLQFERDQLDSYVHQT